MDPQIRLVPFDQTYLDFSWGWLNDAETKRLTLTPDFTREDQVSFFDSLPDLEGYRIWGVEYDSEPIGAAGLKNFRGTMAEYWGYIGEKAFWGRGLGSKLMGKVEDAAYDLGFLILDLNVSESNERAIRLYEKHGYFRTEVSEGVLRMLKRLEG